MKKKMNSIEKMPGSETQINGNILCAIFILLALFVILLRTAWVSDDACISFRTVDNFLHGYGLRWNVSERVQTYTNPLMVFCMIILCFFTKEYYLTAMIFNICCTFAAVLIFMFGIAKGEAKRFALPMVLLICSTAFIDFSTSGLENSLEYLIAAIFYYFYLRWDKFSKKRLLILSFIGCLALLNRMDSILLFLPALFDAFFLKGEDKWYKNILPGVIGIIPFIIWEMFSLFYYGFLFPNTAYAKLNSGIPNIEYIQQGIVYYLDFINRDPIAFLGILLAGCLAIYWYINFHEHKFLCMAAGMLLYNIYILRVGGDFMSGRFFAVIIFISAIILIELKIDLQKIFKVVMTILLITICLPNNNILSDASYPTSGIPVSGIADERSFYYQFTGLLNAVRQNGELTFNRHPGKQRALIDLYSGNSVVVIGNIGFYGLTVGADIHVVDGLALGDALFSRLPIVYKPSWRIGHLGRMFPDGYLETIESGENLLEDKNLAEYYDVLHNIISGDLFSKERFKQIIDMNLGKYDYLIDKEYYRGYVAKAQMTLADFSKPVEVEDVWDNPNAWILDKNGVEIVLDKISYNQKISFFADNNDEYWLLLENDGEIIYRENKGTVEGVGMQQREVILPKDIAALGYDTINIIPYGGDGSYSVGYLQLN